MCDHLIARLSLAETLAASITFFPRIPAPPFFRFLAVTLALVRVAGPPFLAASPDLPSPDFPAPPAPPEMPPPPAVAPGSLGSNWAHSGGSLGKSAFF